MYARMRSPLRNTSRGSISSRRTIASPRPRSTTTLPYSTRLTMPLTISPMRSLYSSYWRSRSASRTFCTITCFADCAAIRPYSSGGSGSAIVSPICAAGCRRRIVEADLSRGIFHSIDDEHVARQMQLTAFRIDLRAHFSLAAVARARRLGDRILHGAEHDLAIDRLFTGDRLGDLQQFEFVGANGRHWSVSLVRSLFALAQRFGNERVGKDKPRRCHVIDAQQHVVGFVTTYAGTFTLGAVQLAAKPFAPVDRDLHFDLGDMAGIAIEIGTAHQWPIDAGR